MRIVSLLFVLLVCIHLNAQERATRSFTTKNGLLSNDVSALHVDTKGRLWIGSKAGLAVQISNEFRQDSISIRYKFNNITSITEDADTNLWIASYGQGVLYRNKKESKLFTISNGLVSNRARKIKIFKDCVYVATNNGVSIISLLDKTIKNPKFKKSADYPFEVTDFFEYQDKVYATTINNGVYEVTISELVQVSDVKRILSAFKTQDALYLGTEEKLLQFDVLKDSVLGSYLIPYVWEGTIARDEILSVSSGLYSNEGGLYSLKGNENKLVVSKEVQISFNDLSSLVYDDDRDLLYLGTKSNGLLQVEWNSKIKKYRNFGKVYTSFVLHGKNFIVSEKGLSILKGEELITSVPLETFKKFQVKKQSLFKDIATRSNHFYEIEYTTEASKIVFYKAVVEKNKIWLASNVGIFKMGSEGELESYFPIHTYQFTFFQGKLIETNPYGGVRIYDDIERMKYRYFSETSSVDIPRDVVSIDQDAESVYFASALDGLYQYKNGNFKSFLSSGDFNEAKLQKVVIANSSTVLVATDFNDIYRLTFSESKANVDLAIPHKKIKGTSIDFFKIYEGKLYVATNWGVNVFGEQEYYFINQEQGLDYSVIHDGSFHSNELYLSALEGFFKIDLSIFEKKEMKLKPFVYGFKVNTIPWETEEVLKVFSKPTLPIELSYSENNLQLYFDVLHVKYPNKLEYYYRLKSDEAWINLPETGRLDLQYLQPGNYSVELKIVDLYASQNNTYLMATLIVKPPFYMSILFIIGMVIMLFFIIFIIFKRRIHLLKIRQQRDREFEQLKMKEERKQLIFDRRYAEMRLQALQSQMDSHFIFNILTSLQYHIMGDDKKEALNYLDRFAKFIRFTLEFSSKKAVSLQEELTYLERYVAIEKLRSDRDILFIIENKDEICLDFTSITPLLLQPFVENSILYAFPPRITQPKIQIQIYQLSDCIEVVIRDNGVGIDNTKERVNWHKPKGIDLVKERISIIQNNLNREIEVNSSNKGTSVHIYLSTTIS